MVDGRQRWMDASHAMQSGVAMEMNYKPEPTDPKHLRTGINAAMVDHGALVRLLINKGIITEEEYLDAIADAMEEEVKRYERHLSELIGGNIKLK
jgi:hypothetical protein